MIVDGLARLTIWSLRKIGIRALIYLIFLVIIFGDIVIGLNASLAELENLDFYSIVITALLIGWWLAHSKLAGWQAAAVMTGLGLALIAIRAGGLGNPFFAATRAFLGYSWSLMHWHTGEPLPGAGLVVQLAGELGKAAQELLGRIVLWIDLLRSWTPSHDPTVVTVGWSLLLWWGASWSSWAVRRLGKPWMGLLPALVLFAASMSYSRANAAYLFPILSGTLGLIAWHNYNERETGWEKLAISFAEDLRFDTSLWALAFIIIVMIPALLISQFSPQATIRATHSLIQTTNPNMIQVGNALGLRQRAVATRVSSNPGILPRQHLLGSGVELSKQIVMLIRVTGEEASGKESVPGSHARHYWQAASYDIYTGHGWLTSATHKRNYREGQAAWSPDAQAYPMLEQEVQQVGKTGEQIYQSGMLVSASQAFEVQWRSDTPERLDPFSAHLRQPASQGIYRVISAPTNAREQQMGQSAQVYPEWVTQTYLQLPETLPARVVGLAKGLTSGASTPYERVRAVESYLRKIPYTLEVPEPPKERDVVDYYLFDLKKGYCDYSATALVVLARAVGIPARLVIGYAQGQYDPPNGVYVVTEADAHSWPEVYFAGVGWVEFEPTAGQPEIVRPERAAEVPAASLPQERGLSLPALPTIGQIGVGAAGLAGLWLLVAWVWPVADAWRLNRTPGKATMRALYRRMYHAAARLKLEYQPGETPLEYASRVSGEMEKLAQAEHGEAFGTTRAEIQRLAVLYAQTVYSPQEMDKQGQREAIAIWRELRGRFWRAWWRRRWNEVVSGRSRRKWRW
jgi:hypothetical protein